ncbi:hypothetical protein CR513_12495, partial [Mucuna pruriens]
MTYFVPIYNDFFYDILIIVLVISITWFIYTLVSHRLSVKLSKCVFIVDIVHYLGHIISTHDVSPDPENFQLILDWPKPRSTQWMLRPH